MKTRKTFATVATKAVATKAVATLAVAAVTVSAPAFCIPAFAQSQPEALLTLSDGKKQVCVCYPVPLSDADGDGAITVNDVLTAYFDERDPGGYAAEETEYGLSMTKLCGIENGGAYGYYVNNASAWSLLDPISGGDHLYAFVYSDTAGFSDTYSFFDGDFLYMEDDTAVITLNAASFDENWNPVTVPVVGAEITVAGKKTGVFTDENGKAVLTIKDPGVYNVSAVSETQTLVFPVCVVTRAEKAGAAAPVGNPVTGVSLSLAIPALSALAAFAVKKRD